jgi:hypothetical protein
MKTPLPYLPTNLCEEYLNLHKESIRLSKEITNCKRQIARGRVTAAADRNLRIMARLRNVEACLTSIGQMTYVLQTSTADLTTWVRRTRNEAAARWQTLSPLVSDDK